MAFENIDASALKNALNDCRSSINYYISDNLYSNLANSNVWICDSQNVLRNGLATLTAVYKDLEKELERFLTITNQILKYNEYKADNAQLNKEYNELKPKLEYEVEFENHYYDSETDKWIPFTDKKKVIDEDVKKKMDGIEAKIKANNENMTNIENSVKNGI